MDLNRYRWFGCAALALLLVGCDPAQKKDTPVAPQALAPAVEQAAPQPQQPAAPSKQAIHQQQLQQLIERVNKAYAAGDAAYRRGELTQAKTQFDKAVDIMLSSGLDINSEPVLKEQFDRIVDQVNALEMEALKVGNGFVPKVEETPGEVASDVTFEANPDIEAKAKAQLATTKSDLPLMVNEYVASFINFFANSQRGHNTLLHSFQRAGRYRAMIQRVMAEEGVPQDLIYLAVAESGFQPRAINPKSRAGGMWQFMPYGDYGLKRNAYVDERFDPEKSTRAYARYMKFLYSQLGDWYLSMGAYDWGAGNIQRAVQKTGYADFWELYKRHNLPGETQNYVPEILAAIIIANNPHQYGFDEITLDPPVLTDTVSINYSVDLRLVSDLVGAPIDEIMALNPSLLRMVTPPDGPFDLHLPAGTSGLFQERIAVIPERKRDQWRYHRVTADDTLESIAHTYHVSVSDLANANELTAGESLSGVEAVVVPTAPAASPSAHTVMYTARRGDSLVSIADRFGVSLDQLRRWNKIASGTKVTPGQRLHVAEPVAARSSRSRHRTTITAQDLHPHAKSSGKTTHKKSSSSKSSAHAKGSSKKQK
ncbi:lytic transglycosylase domain-containing protein [Occallatibacter riparius]|uniref:Transglycosylase SLT domain-containing protein n=1 Tax=Occallatibacter riparius TaxID=1002689 RepID=A0A9J7BWU8_9BACT|nr:lytic transglycosylase domain-containing protein [Occallatibacter riparius]UWZ85350.1 transglycosylase SLT domain-containing protein [Occallatibacter riparius]